MSDNGLKSSYSFRPRQDEAEEIKEFLAKQSNFGDAIRYLIENEILENGIRDMSQHIPAKRDVFSPGKKEAKVKTHKARKSKDKENAPKDNIKVENKAQEEIKNIESANADQEDVHEVVEDTKIIEREHKVSIENEQKEKNIIANNEAKEENEEEIAASEDDIREENEEEIVNKFESKYSVDIPSCYD